MKIQRVEIQNFKNIDHATADLQGKNVYLIAPNGAGKTSFIDACFGNMPNKPLKDGERNGIVTVELDEYVVEFTFTEKNQKAKLNIFDKSGQPQKAPATLFQSLFGIKNFNIDEFLNLSANKQVDFIKGILGINWGDIDKIYKEKYEERAFLNKKLKELDGKVLDSPAKLNLKKIAVEPLQEELNIRIKFNQDFNRVKQGVAIAEAEIQELEKKMLELSEKIEKGKKWLSGKEEQSIETAQEMINQAIRNNEEFTANERNLEIRNEARETAKKADLVQEEMDEIQQAKKDELASRKMPVKGLTFDDDQLYLDGLPFESNQINTARKIIAGLEIQFALMSDVKIARFDGSLLDNKSIAEVENWAKEKGVQLFVELVDRDGDELKIEVQER